MAIFWERGTSMAIDQVPTGQTFFLKIEGIDGGSRDAKHPGWFEINGYDWELTQSGTAHTGTGSGAGKVAFSDLLIDLNLDFDGLPALLHDAATGTHIKSVELEGVKNGQPFTFYELKLSDVLVTDVVDRAGGHDTLALDFSKVELTTTEQKDDGSAGGSETFAFDVDANKQGLAAFAAAPGGVAEAAVPAVAEAAAPAVGETVTVAAAAIDQVPTGQTFFLKIEGIDGGSRDAKHPGWFEINGYDWELTQSGTAHTGTGSGAGKVAFSDLLIDLNLDFDGLPALLHDAATGTHIKSVELEGVKNGQPFTFYELKLSDVLVTDVVDRAGGHDTLALDFSKVELTTTEQKDDGSAGGSETFAFDVDANKQGLAAFAAALGGVAEAAVPAVAETVTVAAAAIDQVPTGQTFFLKIEGIDGGSRDAKHPGWFEINGYDWELTQSGTAHTGTGSGAGKVAFSDLLIDLNLDFDGLPALLHDAATGTHIKSVELEGVKNGQPFTFYELKLSDVLVTDVVDRAGGHDTLALDFSKVELTTTEQKDDGSAGGSETFAFDVDANKQGLAAFAAAPGGVAEAAVPAVAEAAAPAVGETVTVAAAAIDQVPTGQTFFLKIEGIDGGSRDAKHPGWFEINGYDWELTQSGTAHTGTGSGAGKVAFSDLLIDLNLDFDGLPALLHDAATGTHIKSVELEGVKNGQPFTFYELK